MSKTFSQLRAELNEVETNLPAVKSSQSVGSAISSAGEKVVNGRTLPKPQLTGPESWGNVKNIKAKPTSLGAVGKSVLGAAGRLASKYSPHATALATGYEVGKSLNNVSGINKVTDKVGKGIASGLQKVGIGKSPEVVKAKEREVSRKPADTGPKTTVQSQSGGGTVNFPAPQTTPSAPAKSVPASKSAPIKSTPIVKSAPTKSFAALSKSAPVTKSASNKSAPVVKSAPAKSAPVTKMAKPVSAPVKKSLPMATKPIEKDPNAGGGFVTARAYGSKTAGITSTKNVYQNAKSKATELSPTPRRDTMTGGKSIPQSSVSKPTSSSSSKTSVKDLF